MSSEILIRLNPTRLSELTEDGSRAILSVATTSSSNIRPPPSKDAPRDQLTSKLLYSTASIGIEAALDGRTLLSNLEFTTTTTSGVDALGGSFPGCFEKRAIGVVSSSDDISKKCRFAVTATDLYSTYFVESAFEHTQVLTRDANTGGDRIVQFIFPFSQNHQLMSITRPRLLLQGGMPVSSEVDSAFGRVVANVAVNALMDEVLLVNDQLSPLPPSEYLRRYAPPRPEDGSGCDGAESEGELLRRLVQTSPSSIGEATIEYHASLLHQAAQVSHPNDRYTLLHRIMQGVQEEKTAGCSGDAFTASSVVVSLRRESILLSGGIGGSEEKGGGTEVLSTPCSPSVFNTHPSSHTSQYAHDNSTTGGPDANPPSSNVLSDLLRNAAATELLSLEGFECHAVACWSSEGDIMTNTFGSGNSGVSTARSGSSFTSTDTTTSTRVFNTKVIPQLCETIAAAGMGNIIRNISTASASGSLSGASRMRYKLVRLAANPACRNGSSSTTPGKPPPSTSAVERDILCGSRCVREQAEFLLTAVDATYGTSIALGLVFNNNNTHLPPLSGILTKVSEWLKAEGVRLQELTAQSRREVHVMSMAAAHILRARGSSSTSVTSGLYGPIYASPSVLVSHSTSIPASPASEQRAAVEMVNYVVRRLLMSCCDRDGADRIHRAATEFVARNVTATVPQFHPGSGPLSQMFLCCGIVGVVISAQNAGSSSGNGALSLRRDISTPSLHSLLQTMLCPTTRRVGGDTNNINTSLTMLKYAQLRQLGRRIQQDVGSTAIGTRVLQLHHSASSYLSETKTIHTPTSSSPATTPSLTALITGGFGAGPRLKTLGMGSTNKKCPTLLATTTIVSRMTSGDSASTPTTNAVVGFVRIHSSIHSSTPLCCTSPGAHGPLSNEAQRRLAGELLRGGV